MFCDDSNRGADPVASGSEFEGMELTEIALALLDERNILLRQYEEMGVRFCVFEPGEVDRRNEADSSVIADTLLIYTLGKGAV